MGVSPARSGGWLSYSRTICYGSCSVRGCYSGSAQVGTRAGYSRGSYHAFSPRTCGKGYLGRERRGKQGLAHQQCALGGALCTSVLCPVVRNIKFLCPMVDLLQPRDYNNVIEIIMYSSKGAVYREQ